MLNLKNELIKTVSQKISITEILLFEEKETVKTISKGAIHKYILAFAGWQSIFWVVVGGGGCILAGGGWWWVMVNIFWLMVVGGGWWWVVPQFSLTPFKEKIISPGRLFEILLPSSVISKQKFLHKKEIFKTTNTKTLIMVILKSPYKLRQTP